MSTLTRRLSPVLALCLLLGALMSFTATSASAASPGIATAISAGGYHGCAITPKERLKCWGDNDYGQLGIGASTEDEYKPVLVPNLENVKKVSAGDYHTCAVLKGGKLKCWGYNYYGAVGDGSTTDRRTPKQVDGLTSGVKSVSAGGYHTCALLTNGKVKCWGYNPYGEIGNGTSGNEFHTPRTVSNIENASHVSAGYYFTCATVNEKAKCWGYNDDGELGDGTEESRDKPTQVKNLDKNVKRVIAGYYQACAIVGDGRLKCWGYNGYGEIGTGDTGGEYLKPQQVAGMESGVTNVDPDYQFTCAVQNGKAKCWGDNQYNQLGNGETDPRDVPTQVSGLTENVVDVDTGYYHACALLKSGAEKCWGYNGEGEVGINDEVNDQIATPKRVLL